MCGQFGQEDLSWAEIYQITRRFLDQASPPNSVVRPTDQAWVIARDQDGLFAQTARFWFVPSWHKGTLKDWKATTFNARIEDIETKPSFRAAWQNGHILVPASHYVEWTGTRGNKTKWHIRPKTNMPFFVMAGIVSYWQGLPSFALLTRAANDSISHIHHRMPVILNQDEIEGYLAGSEDKYIGEDAVLEAFEATD